MRRPDGAESVLPVRDGIVGMKKRVSGKIATTRFETKSLSISISNDDGVHTHIRNGEKFRGKQKDCPLCANGSAFEKAMGTIGV